MAINEADVQAQIIAFLKLKPTVTSLVPAAEIREVQWQGHQFTYPNIRVAVTSLVPIGNDDCSERNMTSYFSIFVFTEDDSSLNNMNIMSAVRNSFEKKQLTGATTFRSGLVGTVRTLSPIRDTVRSWRGQIMFISNVYNKEL